MRLFFYPPFKPLGHEHPSGDLVIAGSLVRYLAGQGHEVMPVSRLRARWITWRPWLWPRVIGERRRLARLARRLRPDLWLTYHTYYKAPDLIGPRVCQRAGLPYVIFQASYATRRRRALRTWPGFILNRRALLAADHIFTNRRDDTDNLARLVPAERLSYVAPGIRPSEFRFDAGQRGRLRRAWGVGEEPVVVTAAMFRPGVKSRGLAWVIRACGRLVREGTPLLLAVAGDGSEREKLKRLAEQELAGRVRFVGRLAREEMYGFYSAGDVFVFPGFEESLGMVFLEAESCGLPVVACADGGVAEVVSQGVTGVLTPKTDFEAFVRAVGRLLADPDRRRAMGRAAAEYVRTRHDLDENYRVLEQKLLEIAGGRARQEY
jgi:glycosyltransferase involved in cell wall biosynthesis